MSTDWGMGCMLCVETSRGERALAQLESASISASVLEDVQDPWLQERGIHLRMLRLDRIHPQISGNKWFILRQVGPTADRLRALPLAHSSNHA